MQDDNQNLSLELLSIGDASEYLGISIDTLRRWEKKGRIEPLRSPGGHRYYNKKSLEDLFGKRYTRDEETVRTTKDIEPSAEESLPSQPTTHNTHPTPPTGLPSWRMVKDQVQFEEKIEVASEVPLITDHGSRITILSRPSREVKIPEITTISIVAQKSEIKETVTEEIIEPSAQEAYFKQQNVSILTPSFESDNSPDKKSDIPIYNKEYSDIVVEEEPPTSPLKANPHNSAKKLTAFILFMIGLILASYAWYVLWQKSLVVLSPIP